MKANEIVKSIMSIRHLTQIDLQKMLELKSQSAVSGALNRDMKTSTLARFLEIMDCELVIRDKSTGTEWVVSEK